MGYADNSPLSDTPGYAHVSLEYVKYATVDNNNYHYWLHVFLLPTTTSSRVFQYALVEYEFPA